MHTYMNMHTYTYIHTHAYIHTCIHTHAYIHTHTYIHTYIPAMCETVAHGVGGGGDDEMFDAPQSTSSHQNDGTALHGLDAGWDVAKTYEIPAAAACARRMPSDDTPCTSAASSVPTVPALAPATRPSSAARAGSHAERLPSKTTATSAPPADASSSPAGKGEPALATTTHVAHLERIWAKRAR